jgi:GNAT superfamily N-acetyltransferase
MDVNPMSIEVLRSVRRMELKSKSAFCGGFYEDMGPVVLGGCEAVPDPHFNRISVLEPDKLNRALLAECVGRMVEGVPFFIDVPHPISRELSELLIENGCHPTGESRSSMLLTDRKDTSRTADELDIALVETDTLDVFLDLFLRGFDTPEYLVPVATGLFHDLVLRNCHHGNSRLYLGTFRNEPAATLYLFFEEDEGGVNMVSTKENLRRKGLAAAMVRRTIADARALGIRKLGLEARWDGAPERLYGRLGFITIARHEVFANMPDLKYGL